MFVTPHSYNQLGSCIVAALFILLITVGVASAEVCDKVFGVEENWVRSEGAVYRGWIYSPFISTIMVAVSVICISICRMSKSAFALAALLFFLAIFLILAEDYEVRALALKEGCISNYHDGSTVCFYFVSAVLFLVLGYAIRRKDNLKLLG